MQVRLGKDFIEDKADERKQGYTALISPRNSHDVREQFN